jgi:hypothetical protein
VRLGNGEVRSGTRQQLEEAFNAGHLDGSALVLAAGMSEWVALGELMDRRPQEPVPAPVAAPEPPPLVAAEPPPVIAAEPAPVVTQVVAQEAAPAPAPAETAQEAPAPEAPTDEQTSADSAQVDAPELWQVKLTLKQLEDAFNAGLIEDDTPVLAAGADEWVELGTLRREQPAPFGDAVGVPSSQDGAPAEPASRTEPWPATLAGNSHSPTGE